MSYFTTGIIVDRRLQCWVHLSHEAAEWCLQLSVLLRSWIWRFRLIVSTWILLLVLAIVLLKFLHRFDDSSIGHLDSWRPFFLLDDELGDHVIVGPKIFVVYQIFIVIEELVIGWRFIGNDWDQLWISGFVVSVGNPRFWNLILIIGRNFSARF